MTGVAGGADFTCTTATATLAAAAKALAVGKPGVAVALHRPLVEGSTLGRHRGGDGLAGRVA